MSIIGGDGDIPIRPEGRDSARKTRGDQQELMRWALGVPQEQRDEPLLCLTDVLTLLKAAKECVGEGVRDTVPLGVPPHLRPLFIKAMAGVGQGACDFLGYGLVEACRMRLEQKEEEANG